MLKKDEKEFKSRGSNLQIAIYLKFSKNFTYLVRFLITIFIFVSTFFLNQYLQDRRNIGWCALEIVLIRPFWIKNASDQTKLRWTVLCVRSAFDLFFKPTSARSTVSVQSKGAAILIPPTCARSRGVTHKGGQKSKLGGEGDEFTAFTRWIAKEQDVSAKNRKSYKYFPIYKKRLHLQLIKIL